MAQGYTLEQLQAMGGQPAQPKGLTLQQLQAMQQKKPQGFLDKAAGVSDKLLNTLTGFTGLDKAGESLGRLGLQLGNQMQKVEGPNANAAVAKLLHTSSTPSFDVPKSSGKQLAGDALTLAGTGLNLAAPGGGSLGKTVLANAGAAGLLGAGNDLTQGKSVGQALESGAGKAAVAGAVTGGVGLLGRSLGALLKNGSTSLADSVVGDSAKKTGAKIVKGAPTIGQELLQDPSLSTSDFLSAPRLASGLGREATTQESALQGVLESPQFAGRTITSGQTVPYEAGLRADASHAIGDKARLGAILDKVQADVPESMTLPDANLEKRGAWNRAYTNAGDPASSDLAMAQRSKGQAIKDLLEKATAGPDGKSPLAPINQKLGTYSQAISNLIPKIGKEANTSPFMPNDAIILGAGAAEGQPALGGVVDAVKKFLGSPSGKLAAAKIGSNTGNALSGAQNNLVIQAMKRLGRVGAVNALGKL